MAQLITAQTTFLSHPRCTLDQALAAIVRRGTDPSYTAKDVNTIVHYYWDSCIRAGIDPLLAVSQMIHETGNLTSWWSLRPRRNPAGIGVTGRTRLRGTRADASESWMWNERNNLWSEGHAFANWDLAIRAHIGHLVLYIFTDEELNDERRALIAADPRSRKVPLAYRGTAKLLAGLGGRWAVPGTTYADKIATIAEHVRLMP